MRKIFYNSETLEIRAMSDGDNPVDLPSIEVKEDYHSFQYLKLVRNGKKIEVVNEEPKVDFEAKREEKRAKREMVKIKSAEIRKNMDEKQKQKKEKK